MWLFVAFLFALTSANLCPTTVSGITGSTSDCVITQGTTETHYCRVVCDEAGGYQTGSAQYKCAPEDGNWNPVSTALVCSPVICEQIPSNIENSDANCGTDPNARAFGNSACTVSCQAGYEGAAVTYTCGASGEWVPASGAAALSCAPVDCTSTIDPPIAHASYTCTDTKFRDLCYVACDNGYDGPLTAFQCSASGNWTSSQAHTCSPRQCPTSISTISSIGTTTCTGYTYQETCQASCKNGYSGASKQYTCGANGEWSADGNDPLVCVQDSCPGLMTEVNVGVGASSTTALVNAGATCATTNLGQECEATCNSGYTGNSVTYNCWYGGVWTQLSSVSMSCAPVDCTATLPVSNAQYTCAETTYGGANCEASCATGYEGASKAYSCSTSGDWLPATTALSCTPKSCGDLTSELTNGEASCSSNTYNSHCDAKCAPGYYGTEVTYVCDANGDWGPQGSALSCQPLDCGSVISLLPDPRSYDCTGKTTFGSAPCEASCVVGFTGTAKNYVCSTSGTWVPETDALACTAVDCTTTINGLANATSSCGEFQGTTFGYSCEATCNEGFETNTGTFHCQANGEWTPVGTFECVPKDCGELQDYLNSKNIQGAEANECVDTTFGNSCDFGCSDVDGVALNYTYSCSSLGIWTAPANVNSTSCYKDDSVTIINNNINEGDSKEEEWTVVWIFVAVFGGLLLLLCGGCYYVYSDPEGEKRGIKKGLTKKQIRQLTEMFPQLTRQDDTFNLLDGVDMGDDKSAGDHTKIELGDATADKKDDFTE